MVTREAAGSCYMSCWQSKRTRMKLIIPSAQWQSFCLGLNLLNGMTSKLKCVYLRAPCLPLCVCIDCDGQMITVSHYNVIAWDILYALVPIQQLWHTASVVAWEPSIHSTGLRPVPDLSRFENRDQSGINVNWTAVVVNWSAMSGNVAAWSGRSGEICEHAQRLPPI